MCTFTNIAYGSNLHPVRLKQKDRCPSARLIGTGKMNGWKLAFHKRSRDGSVKCNAVNTGQPGHVIWVAAFEIVTSEKPNLDGAEGLGKGYHQEESTVVLADTTLRGIMYLADPSAIDDTLKPYDWYKEMVLAGAQYHGFPNNYVCAIAELQAQSDPDSDRSRKQWRLVEELKSANKVLESTAGPRCGPAETQRSR